MLLDEAKNNLNMAIDKLTAGIRVAEQILGVFNPECKKLRDDSLTEFKKTVAGIFQDLDKNQHQELINHAALQSPLYSYLVKPDDARNNQISSSLNSLR